ncbi:MAG: hypothetical protein ABI361_07090 [Nitrososphaera sp.]|jgi:hypothetical protein
MLSPKRIVIFALLAVDGLLAFSVLMSGPTIQSVVGLIFLNAVVGGPAYAASYFLSKRSPKIPDLNPKPKTTGGLSLNLSGLFKAKPSKPKSSKPAVHAPVLTKKGESVSSIAEQRIADHLSEKGVSYDYLVLSRLASGRRVKRSAFYLSDYSAFVLFRTRLSSADGGEGLASDEETEWQRMRPEVQDLKFIIFRQKDLRNLESSLNSVLAQLDSLRMPS